MTVNDFTQKLLHGFGFNFLGRLGMTQRTIDSILGVIGIMVWMRDLIETPSEYFLVTY